MGMFGAVDVKGVSVVEKMRAAHLAVIYSVVAIVWIAFSDGALAWLGLSAEMITRYSFVKGLAFVFVTGFALYFLVARFAREIAESDCMYRELFDQNPNPMWFYDLETLAFLKVNDAAIRKYGYSREQFLQMTISDIRPHDDLERLMVNIEATREGATGDVDEAGVWRHRTKAGALLWVDITSHRTTMNGREAEVVLVRDVTEAHEAREELLRTQVDLERMIAVRTAELERVNEELRLAASARSAPPTARDISEG